MFSDTIFEEMFLLIMLLERDFVVFLIFQGDNVDVLFDSLSGIKYFDIF